MDSNYLNLSILLASNDSLDIHLLKVVGSEAWLFLVVDEQDRVLYSSEIIDCAKLVDDLVMGIVDPSNLTWLEGFTEYTGKGYAFYDTGALCGPMRESITIDGERALTDPQYG